MVANFTFTYCYNLFFFFNIVYIEVGFSKINNNSNYFFYFILPICNVITFLILNHTILSTDAYISFLLTVNWTNVKIFYIGAEKIKTNIKKDVDFSLKNN